MDKIVEEIRSVIIMAKLLGYRIAYGEDDIYIDGVDTSYFIGEDNYVRGLYNLYMYNNPLYDAITVGYQLDTNELRERLLELL